MQVPALRVIGLGKGLEYAGLQGARAAPPYGASHNPALPHFFVSAEIGMQSHGNWGQEPFGGSGFDFKCPEFVGFLDISVEDWHKAVSRMAAPRGPVLGHR